MHPRPTDAKGKGKGKEKKVRATVCMEALLGGKGDLVSRLIRGIIGDLTWLVGVNNILTKFLRSSK